MVCGQYFHSTWVWVVDPVWEKHSMWCGPVVADPPPLEVHGFVPAAIVVDELHLMGKSATVVSEQASELWSSRVEVYQDVDAIPSVAWSIMVHEWLPCHCSRQNPSGRSLVWRCDPHEIVDR